MAASLQTTFLNSLLLKLKSSPFDSVFTDDIDDNQQLIFNYLHILAY